eukprot:scaffold1541_cov256-Pinguiococcus_pyrenoidosus.AAC.8
MARISSPPSSDRMRFNFPVGLRRLSAGPAGPRHADVGNGHPTCPARPVCSTESSLLAAIATAGPRCLRAAGAIRRNHALNRRRRGKRHKTKRQGSMKTEDCSCSFLQILTSIVKDTTHRTSKLGGSSKSQAIAVR